MRDCTFSCCLHLPVEAGNDSAGSVPLVEGVGELLASRLELLPQGERVQHACVLGSVHGRGAVVH